MPTSDPPTTYTITAQVVVYPPRTSRRERVAQATVRHRSPLGPIPATAANFCGVPSDKLDAATSRFI